MSQTELTKFFASLLDVLISRFGPDRTILIFGAIIVGLGLYRLYKDHRADQLVKLALDEKERQIQRISEQEREWRVFFFTNMGGMSAEEARALILRNDFANPQEARRFLEKKPKAEPE